MMAASTRVADGSAPAVNVAARGRGAWACTAPCRPSPVMVPALDTLGRWAPDPSGEVPAVHLPCIAPAAAHHPGDRRLEARVHHAVGAAGGGPGLILVPVGLLHQFLEGLVVAVGDEVAGALPAL